MNAINPYQDLPNIYYSEDGNTYSLIVDNQLPIELKWDEDGNNRIRYDAPYSLDESIKQQIDILEERLIRSKISGVEVEQEDPDLDPFDPNQIAINTKIVNVTDLMRRLEQQTIKLDPDFQRREVWDMERKCQLIESLLLKIPIPLFYVAADSSERWTVVDGLQRISAIRDYTLGKDYLDYKLKKGEQSESKIIPQKGAGFPLKGLSFCADELEGKRMIDLEHDEKLIKYYNRIVETNFTFVIIDPSTPEEVKFNVFKRINTGGMQLTSQEIRNALYGGPATRLLNELSATKEFKTATTCSVKDNRMEDKELILRFLAFHLRDPFKYGKTYNIDNWLSEAMIIINALPNLDNRDFKKLIAKGKVNKDDILITSTDKLKKDFILAMCRGYNLFGEHAFRKSCPGQRRTPINKSLFETWGVLLSQLNETEYNNLVKSKNDLMKEYESILRDDRFIIDISRDSMKKTSVENRYTKIRNLINNYK